MRVMEVAKVGNAVDTGPSNLMLTASPMTVDAASETFAENNPTAAQGTEYSVTTGRFQEAKSNWQLSGKQSWKATVASVRGRAIRL